MECVEVKEVSKTHLNESYMSLVRYAEVERDIDFEAARGVFVRVTVFLEGMGRFKVVTTLVNGQCIEVLRGSTLEVLAGGAIQ